MMKIVTIVSHPLLHFLFILSSLAQFQNIRLLIDASILDHRSHIDGNHFVRDNFLLN